MRAVAKDPGSKRGTGPSSATTSDGRGVEGLAWSLWAVIVVVGAASLVLRYLNGSALTSSLEGADYLGEILWWDVLVPAAIPAYATIGAVLTSRRPQNLVGWMCLAVGVLVAAVEAGWEYAARAFEVTPSGAPLPLEVPVAWISHVLNPLLPVPFILMLLLFPDGRLPSRRWRPVVWAAAAGAGLVVLSGAFGPIIGVGLETNLSNPVGIGALGDFAGFVDAAWFPALAVLLLLSVSSVFSRWRGSRDVERQQLKWLAYAGAVVATAVLCGIASAVASGTSYLTVLLFGVGISGVTVGVPLAIGTAILRYRLYDVDLVINRTLVYGALTAAIVGIYVLVVGYLGAAFRTGGNLAISLIATGIVAVLFQPLRDRLQRAANRLVYGERDDPYAVLSRLGRRLEETLAPEATLEAIVETVAEALKLPYAGVTLRGREGFETAAEHSEPPVEGPLVLPLTYGPETVGQLVLVPRGRGESFTKSDLRLLEDLARQIGVAAHAVRLTADLQRSRERLVSAREEERRRLRRDLHDGVGPQLAALTLKLETARRKLAADPAADALFSDLGDRTRAAVADIRRAVYALRPPALDEFGLVAVLRETAAQYGQNGPEISVDAPEDLPPLPAAVEVAAYRIAGEALTNVVRHAEARTCVVRIALDEGALRLEVSDDGRGVGVDRGAGVGLRSMRERAEELGGVCTVEPGPGGGTRVSARLPLEVSGIRPQASGKSKGPVAEASPLQTRRLGVDSGTTGTRATNQDHLKPDA